MAKATRRQLLAGGSALGWYLLSGAWTQTTAAEAQRQGYQPHVLSTVQAAALAALAEVLVPGAKTAGILPYIDSQLMAGEHSLLMAKYLGVPPEQQPDFYRPALDSIHRHLQTPGATAQDLPALMAQDAVPHWQGPPASFFYFVLRADALDVTYGSEQGFAALDIPYMAHISPEAPW